MSNDCFLDLQRAATSLYLNPRGKTHHTFLRHAQKIADGDLSTAISRLQKKASSTLAAEETARVADEILTLGIMLKGK